MVTRFKIDLVSWGKGVDELALVVAQPLQLKIQYEQAVKLVVSQMHRKRRCTNVRACGYQDGACRSCGIHGLEVAP